MKKHWVMGIISGLSLSHLPAASAGGVLAIDNPAAHGTANGAFASMQLFAGDDNLPVPAYVHDWRAEDYSSKSGANVGVVSARSEAGVQMGGLRIGYLARADGMVRMGQEVADLYYLYQNHQPYRAGQVFAGRYQMNIFTADGLHLSDSLEHAFSNGMRLALGGGISYLRGDQLKMQTIAGQVQVVGPKDFNFSAQMQSDDARRAAGSYGYALDAGGRLTLKSGTHIDFAINDLGGRMHWKNVPITDEVADSDPGSVIQNGSFSGRKYLNDITMALHPKAALGVTVPINQLDMGAEVSATQGIYFPQAEVGYRFRSGWRLGLDYDVRFKSSGVTLANRWFSLAAQAQNWSSLNQSRAYGLASNVNVRF